MNLIYYAFIIQTVVLVFIIFKKEDCDYKKEMDTITSNNIIYNQIVKNFEICKILFICNRNLDGVTILNNIYNLIIYLNNENFLNFNTKLKLNNNVIELKNLLLSLDSFKKNESDILNKIILLLNKKEDENR